MKIENRHPSLPLTITDGMILGPDGVVGYVNCGNQYLYVVLYDHKIVVAEHNSFDSIIVRKTEEKIKPYRYAFKILCSKGTTAVIAGDTEDIVLIGLISGYLTNGEPIWRDANDISTWPGLKGVLNEA